MRRWGKTVARRRPPQDANYWLTLALAFLLGYLLMLYGGHYLIGPAHSHSEHAQTAQLQDWLKTLRNRHNMVCCDGRDNKEVEYWEPLPDGSYKIRVEGVDYDVDRLAVVEGPNKLGFPQAWFGFINGKKYISCFLPGALF